MFFKYIYGHGTVTVVYRVLIYELAIRVLKALVYLVVNSVFVDSTVDS